MAANTIPTLSYANTFGDWVVATNFLINQNNQASTNSFTKAAGTYYFNDPSLGLSVANNAIIGGGLQVVGSGSFVTVQNGLTAGQGTFSNTGTSLTVAGSSNFANTININGPGTGLDVANNVVIRGSLTVNSNTSLNTLTVANGASFLGTTAFNGSLIVGGATAYNYNTGQWNISVTGTSGNANTVTNGIYSNLYYSDPTWLTGIANTKILGFITGSQIAPGSITSSQIAGGAIVGTITGTANQVIANNSTGNILLSTPQNIGTGANFRINSLGVGTAASTTAGEIRAVNNITAYYSDDRLKTRLGNIEGALDKVMSLNGFHYEANETAQALGYDVKSEVGLSAQEVQVVLPEVVVPAPIDEKYLTIHYERIIPLLVEAIKELKAEVDSLKK
jgi:hypothetical protein